MSSVAQRLMTAEEFSRLPGSKHKELVRGVVVESMPPSKEHGRVALAIGSLLRLWVKQGAGGQVGVESGFILAQDPGTVRGPDVHCISDARVASDNAASAFWTITPDLAVEVVSPSDTEVEVREKVRDFLAAGTPLVWTVYPRTREVVA
ncbi:MAG TPA: Uma2 family endonuclease, partial [Chloroflexia bacterium]|nr:Uma2 family endonuclease [Chloroflexia bacterium]